MVDPSKRVYNQSLYEVENQFESYGELYKKLYPGKEMQLSTSAIEHVQEWADLNAESENSTRNWRKLYRGEMKDTIRDEGSLFKEIMMTTDLLKQLIEVAQTGVKHSKSYEDREYYLAMELKFKQALDLIQREPAAG